MKAKLGSRRDTAFSLVELMISIGILATSLLLVVGIFVTVTRVSQKTLDLTAGTIIAESMLSRELYAVMADSTSRDRLFRNDYSPDAQCLAQRTERLNQTVFTCNIYASSIVTDSTSAVYRNRVKKVDAVVWWWNEGSGSVAGAPSGYGFLRAEVSRLLNENSKF